ncbi:transglycosylase domain-containing protein [Streptomyces sp. TLI_171]|uniref:transglycosylase domain-containing protein n=1 Tax=Streptomyces sp. TLI_171 TaxID=1938859 RepID=UPI000C17AFA1|nr:transglycosylase domain-containing protein [Streptomyces sp. TLI_171]RKE20282.1 membrane peptidoglycan carboxypeptidase [Streptomyces sp. TLI_171]
MSEHRRRSANPGGEQPSRRADAGRPYAYGSPVEGAPEYGPGRTGGPGAPGAPRSGAARSGQGPVPGARRATRQTAEQPRLTRAEMRKQAKKGGGGGRGSAGGPPNGRSAGRNGKPGKKRLIDYPRFGRDGFKRWVPSWKQVLSLFLIFFGGGVAAVGTAYALVEVPNEKAALEIQSNVFYWADGTEMARTGNENQQLVQLSEISRPAQDAVIAAENETFRSDSGIDPKGIARAVYKMATGGETQGGSTITQQYVKNVYLSQDQTLSRKAKEFFITLKVNGEKTKDQILQGYLNTSWYGRGATGIQAAAQAYYGVDASKIDACQGAMLAGLLKGAGLYDPSLSKENHQRMVERWSWILDRMVTTKALSAEDRAKCKDFPEPIDAQKVTKTTGEITYLIDVAKKYVTAKDPSITAAALDRGGYQIHTTFQKDKVDALKKSVDDFSAATLKPDTRKEDQFVQVGAASVEPGGAIVALYGGPGAEKGQYSNNADGKILVGSTFKPIVLAAAMEDGVLTKNGEDGTPAKINPDSRYLADDNAQIYRADGSKAIGDDGKPYHQRNSDPGNKGYVTLRTAMQWSYNVPFVQLGQDVGGDKVRAMAEKLGMHEDTLAGANTLTLPLGTSVPSAIRLASVYSVFAAHGQQTDPYSVSSVKFRGKDLPNFAKPAPKAALDPLVADTITDVLQNAAKNGTGSKTNELGFPVAGKTGTTDKSVSAWFVGYTPSLVTSVGMWREEAGTNKGLLDLQGTGGKKEVHGGDYPADIFTRYMKVVGPGNPRNFTPPSGTWGEEVDSSGAPVTASPSASASASPTEQLPTGPAEPSPSTTPEPSTDPSPSSSPSCLLGLCPPTKSPRPSKSPTDTASPSASPGAAGGGGGQ